MYISARPHGHQCQPIQRALSEIGAVAPTKITCNSFCSIAFNMQPIWLGNEYATVNGHIVTVIPQ